MSDHNSIPILGQQPQLLAELNPQQTKLVARAKGIASYLTLMQDLRAGKVTAQVEIAGVSYDLTAATMMRPLLEIICPVASMSELLRVCANLSGAPTKTMTGDFKLKVSKVEETVIAPQPEPTCPSSAE